MKFADNILKIHKKISSDIGRFEEEMFDVEIFNLCTDLKIESPIEQVLLCALKAVQQFNFIKDAEPVYLEVKEKNVIRGLEITPQKKIGKFRCDFFLTYYTMRDKEVSLIVECDSQEFHDTTEKQRRYEKARDRFFIANSYKVFHFTGAEILRNPYKIAVEIITYLTKQPSDELAGYLDFEIEGEAWPE